MPPTRDRSPLASVRSAVYGGSLAVALAVAGCSGSDDDRSTDTMVSTVSDTAARTTVSTGSTRTSTSTEDAPTPTTARPASPTTPVITVPDSGVPGLDSDDAFCRSWSEFAGSFQALALVSSVGSDPVMAARDELAASSLLLAAVAGLDEHLPEELEPERTEFIVGYVGPMATRAGDARDALLAAGLEPLQVEALGAVWLETLEDVGLDTPIEHLPIDPAVADAVEQAAVAFLAARPPIVEDPALITDAQVPRTLDHLAANCPDQGILAGSDS